MQRVTSILRTALRTLPLSLTLFAAAAAGGCVLYGEPDDYRTCADVACGNNASCGEGKCFCDPGYEGNPYDGCLATQPKPDESCEADCGQNAYCSEGECYCELDHVAVCGPGAGCVPESILCDGAVDCANGGDEEVAVCSKSTFQEWLLTDSCDDQLDIEWRLFSQDRDWSWPGGDSVFRSPGHLVDAYQTIQCFEGEMICFAGKSGETTWGFNLDGSGMCDACCAACGSQELLDLGYLTCE